MNRVERNAALAAWIGVLSVALAVHATGVPPAVCAHAAGPALLWSTVAWLAGGRDRPPAAVLAGALLAGAVAAALPASYVNQALADWLAAVGGAADASWATTAIVAPVVEEMAKALALGALLAIAPGRALGIRAGLACGAIVGIGFSFTENLQYLTLGVIQGGTRGLWIVTYLRGMLGGLQHGVFTAWTGIGLACALGASTTPRRSAAVGLGLSAAVAQHVLWNAVVAGPVTDLLCGAELPGDACRAVPEPLALFVAVPLLALAVVAPAIGTMVFLAGRDHPIGSR